MMNEYDVVSVYTHSSKMYTMHSFVKHNVLVPKKMYDADLEGCLPYLSDAWRQFKLDIFRSDFRMKGEKVNTIPDETEIDPHLIRYCTQSVMGIPVVLLWQLGVVAELDKHEMKTKHLNTKMRIDVVNDTLVLIQKQLRIVDVTHSYIQTKQIVDVEIQVDSNQDLVELSFTQCEGK